ncbi:MAG: carbohydrate kinase [Granulosicoccus sp.]
MFMSCGDALVDLFSHVASDGAERSPGEVALNGHVGGSPLNVAVGLARLGNPAAYLCKNSSDFMGQRIAHYLRVNRVDTDYVVPTDLNSTLAMVQTNADGSANYAFYTDNTADVSLQINELPNALPDELAVLNFASYSTAVDPTRSALLALAQREQHQRVIAYDPNLRPSIEPDMDIWRESFAKFSDCASFLKASDEDIHTLMGSDTSLENFATDAISSGVDVVVVTEGSEGATVYTSSGERARSARIGIDVVDTVGAGDTFQCASLHYLKAQGHVLGNKVNGDDIDLQVLVDFAATAAAITCSRRGADLPTLAEVEASLAKK